MISYCVGRLRMVTYSVQLARVVLAFAALLASSQPSHGFTPGTATPAPTVSCLRSDCTFPTVQANFWARFNAPSDSCPATTSFLREVTSYNGLISISAYYPFTYHRNKYCVWNLGPTSTCKYTYVLVTHARMGPRAEGLNCTHSYDSPCCQCRNHLSVSYSNHNYCLVDERESPFPTAGDQCVLDVHSGTGDLIVSYRTDANRIAIGSGFHIYVYKDLGTVHDCSQAQDIDFDVKTMPHIKGCPSLTHDQLVARVVRFSDELIKNKTQTPSKDPLLRAHLFTPPHMQCYCFGTCTAKSAVHRLRIMKNLTTQPGSFEFSAVSYINSPDPILRKVARAVIIKKPPLPKV